MINIEQFSQIENPLGCILVSSGFSNDAYNKMRIIFQKYESRYNIMYVKYDDCIKEMQTIASQSNKKQELENCIYYICALNLIQIINERNFKFDLLISKSAGCPVLQIVNIKMNIYHIVFAPAYYPEFGDNILHIIWCKDDKKIPIDGLPKYIQTANQYTKYIMTDIYDKGGHEFIELALDKILF